MVANLCLSGDSILNYWHESTKFEATVGFEAVARQRAYWLPQRKVDAYCADIDELISAASKHPQKLMPKALMIATMGRLSSASGPVPRIWRHFGALLSLVAVQKYELYVQSNAAMEATLRALQTELRNQSGQPMTSYRLRPGADGRRVWQNFTDSSRNTKTFFGAAGGWFRLWGSNVIFYFAHRWTPAEVAQCNIGELEMVAEMIAKQLQLSVHRELFTHA